MKLFESKSERFEKSIRQNRELINWHNELIKVIEIDICNDERKLRAL